MQKRIVPIFVNVCPASLVLCTAAVVEVLFVPLALLPLAVAEALLT
jgi:hypothetical protein